MHRTLLILLLLSLAAWAYNWPDDIYWGSIAYSQSTGKWGYSRRWGSSVNARRAAVENCGASDAKVVLLTNNAWCALALGDDVSAYGVGYGRAREVAERYALEEARKRTSGAHIALFFNCSDFDYP